MKAKILRRDDKESGGIISVHRSVCSIAKLMRAKENKGMAGFKDANAVENFGERTGSKVS